MKKNKNRGPRREIQSGRQPHREREHPTGKHAAPPGDSERINRAEPEQKPTNIPSGSRNTGQPLSERETAAKERWQNAVTNQDVQRQPVNAGKAGSGDFGEAEREGE